MSSDELPSPQSSTVEEQLLCSARSGDVSKTKDLLEDADDSKLNINVKGAHKSNQSWTPLHLASYFGHIAVAELLLKHGADVNIVNNTGDTPLHKASYTGREEIVYLLLSNGANVFIKNGEGQTARNVSKTEQIRKLLKGAEETDARKKNDLLLHASREGDVSVIKELLQDNNPPSINCVDALGNTALHCAAYRGKKEAAILLLQNGSDSSIKNCRGQLAIDLALNVPMKQILGVQPVKQLQKTALRFEGLLLRKSRFIGWKEIWIVLEKGVLSSFASRADASTGTRRKGYKYLDGASVQLDDKEVSAFVVKFSNRRRQRYCIPFVTYQQLDRQKWVNAITEHIEFSSYYLKQGLLDSENDDDSTSIPLGTMHDKLQTAQAHQQLLENQIEIVKPLCENLVSRMTSGDNANPPFAPETPWSGLPSELSKLVTLSHKVSSSLSHCLSVFSQQEELRQLQFKQQEEQIRVWQDALHVLAQEHHELEKSLGTSFRSPASSPVYPDTDCDEFFDAFEGDYSPPERPLIRHNSGKHSNDHSTESEPAFFASFASTTASIGDDVLGSPHAISDLPRTKWGRAVLPVPMFSRNDFSVWSILKQCIGRELSKITMPVVFNEPLTLLQRVCENIEYSNLLVLANSCDDPVKRMEYVATFAVTNISSNWERLGKPFNPLLGETYELVREDCEFRIVTEQVSHHPPISAFHANSPHFTFCGAIRPKLKFWGRSVEIKPEGTLTLTLLKHNEVYTWSNVTCCVHNIIVGKLWMEQCGVMEVKCHSNGLSAALNFKPAGWFGRDLNLVEGFICDRQMTKLRFMYGKWCSYMRSTDAEYYEDYVISKQPKPSHATSDSAHNLKSTNLYVSLERSDATNGDSLGISHESIPSELLWESDSRPEFSAEYFNFTSFAMALNEALVGQENFLPPTDSRLRPDLRKLEEGDIDGAASEKNRLEEKQRAARNQKKKERTEWTPLWFKNQRHQYAPEDTWVYTGSYWDRNFMNCPDIF